MSLLVSTRTSSSSKTMKHPLSTCFSSLLLCLLVVSLLVLESPRMVAAASEETDASVSKALEYAEAKKATYVDELMDLVRIPSISTLPEHEQVSFFKSSSSILDSTHDSSSSTNVFSLPLFCLPLSISMNRTCG